MERMRGRYRGGEGRGVGAGGCDARGRISSAHTTEQDTLRLRLPFPFGLPAKKGVITPNGGWGVAGVERW
jgi:hypothetical protein